MHLAVTRILDVAAGTVLCLAPVVCCSCAPPGSVPWEDPPPGCAFGDQICLTYYPPEGDDDAARASRAQDLALLAALHTATARLDVLWHEVEPVQGQLDASYLEPALADLAAQHIGVLGILAYSNPLYATGADGDPYYPPDRAEPYGAFGAYVSAELAPYVSSWELWNEPNLGFRFFKPVPDPARYAALARAGAQGVRGGCPGCRVVLGGLAPFAQIDDVTMYGAAFLSATLEADQGLPAQLDSIGWHAYTLYPPCADPEYDGPSLCGFVPEDGGLEERSYRTQVELVQAVLDSHGVALPLTFTEMGWPSWGNLTEDDQAKLLARAVVLAAALRVEDACWWQLYEGDNPDGVSPEAAFGLVRKDGEPKPAYQALRTLAETLGDAVAVRDATAELALSPDDGEHAVLFLAPDRAVTALWREAGERAATVAALPASARRLVSLMGDVSELAVDRPDVTVTLSSAPSYLVEVRPGTSSP